MDDHQTADAPTKAAEEQDDGKRGSVIGALYLVAVGLLWAVNGLSGLMGVSPMGPGGTVELASKPSLATAIGMAIVVVVYVFIVAAWRGRWWGWIALGLIHLGFAGVALSAQLIGGAILFIVVAMLGFVLLGATR